jgi:hypothetical protein
MSRGRPSGALSSQLWATLCLSAVCSILIKRNLCVFVIALLGAATEDEKDYPSKQDDSENKPPNFTELVHNHFHPYQKRNPVLRLGFPLAEGNGDSRFADDHLGSA